MSDEKKLLTIVEPSILEEMKKYLPTDLIVDNVVTSNSSLIIAPLEIAKHHKKPFYTTERPRNYKEIFSAKGLGYLPKDILNTQFGSKFIKIIADVDSISNLADLFGAEVEIIKISQFFQVGGVVDRLTEGASEILNDYLSFHRSLYNIFQFLCYFANKDGFSPIECEKTNLEDGIVIQLSLKMDSDNVNIFRSILLKDENESKNFLTREFVLALEDSDFTDLTFVQKTNRLIVSMFFSSKVKVRNGGFRFSDNLSLSPRVFQETSISYPLKSKEVRVLENQFPDIVGEPITVEGSNDQSNESQIVNGTSEKISDGIIKVKGFKENTSNQVFRINSELAKENFPPAKKFALFIKNYREREGASAENYKLSDQEILNYLAHYPRSEAVSSLSDEAKSLICIMVRNVDVYENVSRAIEDIGQSGFLDKVEEIQEIISSKKLEDIAEIITVKGGNRNYDEEVSRVKGWLEDKKDDLIKINSNYDGLPSNEKWEIKKLHINEVLKQEVERIKANGDSATAKDYLTILSEKLGIGEEDSKFLVEGLIEDSSGDTVISRIEELRQAFIKPEPKVKPVGNTKLEDQIVKMKKIMDGMKAEIIRLRSASISKVSTDLVSPDFQAQLVQVELEKTKQTLVNREKSLKKFKDDIDLVIKEKDKQILNLKEKIEQNKIDDSQSIEKNLEKKNDDLNVENRMLKTKLELSLKKIQNLSENMDKQDAGFMLKKEREVDQLKIQLTMSQTIIGKFKEEKQKLDSEIFNLKDQISSLKMEARPQHIEKNNDTELQKRDLIIQSLTHEKRSAEDQFKLQSVEVKKLEQKLKILTVQNDELTKKKGGSAKNVENAQRQVEQANEKTKEALHELTEKKKDLLKLKNENSIQNVKIQELERKIASLERSKAA